ncbi:MAG: hypothetical protein SFV23_15315 [Planctomycetaceae bacterium]|nr:hypothetical protein [Planctomycetaceae bacterium]
MDGSIRLSDEYRKRLLDAYRGSGDARLARRAHVTLLLADGRTYRGIMGLLFCSSGFVSDVVQDSRRGCVAMVLREGAADCATTPFWWLQLVEWTLQRTPQDFGDFRSRWSCALLAEVLA